MNEAEALRKKRFYVTADFWREQAGDGPLLLSKQEWPRYKEIENLTSSCAFCQYCECVPGAYKPLPDCQLSKVHACGNKGYIKWATSDNTVRERRAGAKYVWEAIEVWMRVEYPSYFKRKVVKEGKVC